MKYKARTWLVSLKVERKSAKLLSVVQIYLSPPNKIVRNYYFFLYIYDIISIKKGDDTMDIQLITQICIVVLIVLIFAFWLAWQIKKKGLKEFATQMIIKAEDIYKKGQNSEKMSFVIEKIKKVLETTTLGKILLIFITEENIEKFIQQIFDNIKLALDYQPKKG